MVSYSILSNLIVSNNIAEMSGGGILLYYKCRNNYINCYLFNNTVSAVSISNSFNNILNCRVISNVAGVYLDHSTNNNITGTISSNLNTGVWLQCSHGNSINADIQNNNMYAIYMTNSFSNTIQGSIQSNWSGIRIEIGEYNVINALVSYNSDPGVYLLNASNNTISGTISYNSNSSYIYSWYSPDGGGVSIGGSSTSNLINGIINGNKARKGAGIYSDGNLFNTISAVIINNIGVDDYSPTLYFSPGNYAQVINSVITNNYSSSGNKYYSISFELGGGNSGDIILSNNIIGGKIGSLATGICIFDNSPFGNFLKVLMNNIFLTNSLSNLFELTMYGGGTNDINVLNSTNFTRAEFVGGNTIQ